VPRLRTGGPREVCSLPDRDKKCMFTSKDAEELWNTPRPSIPGVLAALYWGIKRRSVKLTTHLPLLPGLGMSGVVTPLPHVPEWRAQGQTYPIERNHVLHKIKEGIWISVETDLNEAKKEMVDKEINSGTAVRWEFN